MPHIRSKAHSFEHTTDLKTTPLSSAEILTPAQIEADMPYGERDTWGALEVALTEADEPKFDAALTMFRERLVAGDALDHKSVEASVVLVLEPFYRMRLNRQGELEHGEEEAAIHRLKAIQQLTTFGSEKLESYGFELEVLVTLLEQGYLAFPASPREEGSRYSTLNHDAYLFDSRHNQKAPLQMKLGSASSTRYTHGVRSVSRKSAQRFNGSFTDYLKQQIPEMAQARFMYAS